MADCELLRRLCTAYGISGTEDAVREIIRKEVEPYAASIETDPSGNLIVEKKGAKRPKVRLMLDAHMDEVGMIVTHITDDGMLKFSCVGGIDRRVLCGTPVVVNGKYPGVIGTKPIHLLKSDEREKSVPLDDLHIDIGASSCEEAQASVSLGDPVCFVPFFDEGKTIKGKALDDRAGCALLIEMIRSDLEYDMTFVFSVQEEVGLRGAQTAAYRVAPDAAIAVETTTAADIAGIAEEKQVCRVGKGPVLSFMDRGTIYDREYFRLAKQIAEEHAIPVQVKEAVAGGNNAGAIHKSRGGVRTLAVSLACRYLHAPAGVISHADYESMLALLPKVAEAIASGEKG